MKWFQTIFKGRLDAGKTFDTIASGIDKLAFTNQEKAEFNVKMADSMAEFAKLSISENTIRSRTRRFIAIFLIINIMLIFWLCVALVLLKHDISTILELAGTFKLGLVFITIIAFFFSGYYFTTYLQKTRK